MKIIWALYDDGNCSYKKAIESNFHGQYEVHCMGINDKPFEDTQFYKYHKIDLSITNTNLIKELEVLPKPDIILASPPCESWSIADTIKTYKQNSLSLTKRVEYDTINNTNLAKGYKSMIRNFWDKQQKRLIGESTVMGTIRIIEHFKPDKWVIENPMSSKTWLYQRQFLNFFGYENKTYYNCYGYQLKKPTIFKSNIEMELRTQNIKAEIKWGSLGSGKSQYDKKSRIPEELIKDIINQLEHPINQQERLF